MMVDTNTRGSAFVTALQILVLLEAIVFFIGALLHLGVHVPVGFTEPRIIPATIVESIIGIAFAVAAYALFTRRDWAWRSALTAHCISIAGILLGMAALAAGRGPRTESNDIYHRVMLLIAVVVVVLLLTRSGKSALRPQA
jgi:hypothetical protein